MLDREVGSMTEFKQIVGRGTRVHEETGKYYFTLIDFRGATNHFADPDFDGDPVQIYEPTEDEPIAPPEPNEYVPGDGNYSDEEEAPYKYVTGSSDTDQPGESDDNSSLVYPMIRDRRRKVYLDGVSATIIAERVEYLDEAGKLVTESLRDFTRRALKQQFVSLDRFLTKWNAADRKQAVLDELEDADLPLRTLLAETGREFSAGLGADFDPFDLICHLAFDQPPLTRRERADNVRKRNPFTKYGQDARDVLEALLDKYQDEGAIDLDNPIFLTIAPFDAMGTPVQLIKIFGGMAGFEKGRSRTQNASPTRKPLNKCQFAIP